MKALKLFFTILLLTGLIHIINLGPSFYFQGRTDHVMKEDRPDLAVQQNFEQTKDPVLGRPTPELLPQIAKRVVTKRNQPGSFQFPWVERGPNNVGGRTRALLIDQRDATHNTVWAGGVAGGLWKTTNFLSSQPDWNPIDDFFKNIAITWLAQDPSDPQNLFFGTGEGYYNSDALRGLGIWKSSDGGNSWNQLRFTNSSIFHHIQKVVIDDNGHIYAATRIGGLRSSADGGSSWQREPIGDPSEDFFVNRIGDVEIATNGDIFVATGFFSSESGRLFRRKVSVNGVWEDITPAPNQFNRIEIAVAPSDPDRLYLLCEGEDFDVSHIFRSDNGGDTWMSMTVPTIVDRGRNPIFTRNQAWYDLIAQVDRSNADILYIGGVDALKSSDGGNSWQQISIWTLGTSELDAGFTTNQYVHADHHQITFLPGTSSAAIWCTDGGIFYTSNLNANKPSFISKNVGYNVTQFYSCAIHPDANRSYFLAGSQDNGTQQFDGAGLLNTVRVSGGDGGFCFIDQDEPDIQISSFTRNNYNVTTDSWSTSRSLLRDRDNGLFINPSCYDSDLNTLYSYRDVLSLYRIVDVQSTKPNIDTITIDLGAKATHLAISPFGQNQSILFVGTAGGRLFRIDNAHADDFDITELSNPDFSGSISCVAFGQSASELVVTFSNYGVGSVWLSRDGGQNWRNIEGDLPNFPIRWALFHPNQGNQLMLATEMGIWYCQDVDVEPAVWNGSNNGLANTRIDMLQIRQSDNLVIAATHGRGLFSSNGFRNDDVPCSIVSDAVVDNITHTSAEVIWSNTNVNDQYLLRFRLVTENDWSEMSTSENRMLLPGLIPCRQYELQIKTKCSGADSDYSSALSFLTLGCGDNYCRLFGDGSDGWIESFSFEGTSNNSGNNRGYEFFNLVELRAFPGQDIDIELSTSEVMGSYQITLFFDFNQDETLQASEMIYANSTNESSLSFTVRIPESSILGPTRLRVITSPNNLDDACQGEVIEVEDYTVVIGEEPFFSAVPDQIKLPAQMGYRFFNLFSNQSWQVVDQPNWISMIRPSNGEGEGTITFSFEQNVGPLRSGTIEIGSNLGSTTIRVEQASEPLGDARSDLLPSVLASAGTQGTFGNSIVHYTIGEAVMTNISNGEIWLSQGFHQAFPLGDPTAVLQSEELDFQIYPNPVLEQLIVLHEGPPRGFFRVIDAQGKMVLEFPVRRAKQPVSVKELISGIYLLEWRRADAPSIIKKFIKP